MFCIEEHLTKRDAWSATFEDILLRRTTLREDCPLKLPDLADTTDEHV